MQTPSYIKARLVYKKKADKYRESYDEPEYLELPDKQCEDCGKKCKTRSVIHEWNSDIKAWNNSCSVCTRFYNADTGEYDTTRTAAKTIIKKHLDKRDK